MSPKQFRVIVLLFFVQSLLVAGGLIYTARRLNKIEAFASDASYSAGQANSYAAVAAQNASDAEDEAQQAHEEAEQAHDRADAAATHLGE